MVAAETSQHEDNLYNIVGERIRTQRTLLGLSQDDLGKAIGVSFQQVQKYENGSNQITLSRLIKIAASLQLPITDLISGFDKVIEFAATPSELARSAGFAESGQAAFGVQEEAAGETEPPFDASLLRRRETLELVRAYYSVTDDKKRRKILDLIKSMTDD